MENNVMEIKISSSSLLNNLNWRYATKVFNKQKLIDEELFDDLLEVLRLSPSSIGLQPWKFIVVKNPLIREQLKKSSMEQSQITDASHLIIICSLKNINESYLDKLIACEKESSEDHISTLENYKKFALDYIKKMPKDELQHWMREQCYIALGFLLSACSMLHIDACPIEAIDRERFNEILGLDKSGIEARTAVALGYRSKDDLHAKQKKFRFKREEIINTVS